MLGQPRAVLAMCVAVAAIVLNVAAVFLLA